MSRPAEETDAAARPVVFIKPRGAARLKRGHPWIFKRDVGRAPEDLERGIVTLKGPNGRDLGQALFSRASDLWVRWLTRDRSPVDLSWFEDRLSDALGRRAGLATPDGAYRWVHGEGDSLPGLFVERYGARAAVLQILTASLADLEVGLVDAVIRASGRHAELGPPVEVVVLRHDVAGRDHENLPRETRCLQVGEGGALEEVPPGQADTRVHFVEGGDLDFVVDLVADQKTGAFLDQQENRIRCRALARGRALDVFSYHGGFALHLARGGAEHVEAIEASAAACARIKENAAANDLQGTVSVTEGNAFDVLRAYHDGQERFATIALDPPALAKRKTALDAAYRGYKELNLRALKLLEPGGALITCSCSAHVTPEQFEVMLIDAAGDAGRKVQVIERRGAGRDHPVLLGVPETEYLKCFVLRVL